MSSTHDTVDLAGVDLQEALIREMVERFVAPLVAVDGGSVEVVSVRDRAVVLRLGGACTGCPVRPLTRDDVIAPILSRAVGFPVHVELA